MQQNHSSTSGLPQSAELFDAILTGKAKQAASLAQQALDDGADPLELVTTFMIPAMDEVSRRFSAEEFYVPELLLAGRAMKTALELVRPRLAAGEAATTGRVVIGTVRGDLHDIGKNLVVSLLEGGGFEMVDLGVDVAPALFVNAVRKWNPDIVALSALLTTTMPAMKAVIDALSEAGLRDQVKIIVGGAPVTRQYAEEIGADAYGKDAAGAVQLARNLVGNARAEERQVC